MLARPRFQVTFPEYGNTEDGDVGRDGLAGEQRWEAPGCGSRGRSEGYDRRSERDYQRDERDRGRDMTTAETTGEAWL